MSKSVYDELVKTSEVRQRDKQCFLPGQIHCDNQPCPSETMSPHIRNAEQTYRMQESSSQMSTAKEGIP